MNSDNLEQKIQDLYEKAKTTQIEDDFKEAIAVIKHLRRSQEKIK